MDAQAGLGLCCYKSPDRFSQSRSNCCMCHLTMAQLTMTHIRKQAAKFDYRLFKAFSVNIIDIPRGILLVTVFFIINESKYGIH